MRNRAVAKFVMLAILVAGTIMLVLPATASADALVSTQVPCAFFVGGNSYGGSGTNVITSNGDVVLSCHLSLVSGTPVARPVRTTVGNCEVLETPSGKAEASCHFQLV